MAIELNHETPADAELIGSRIGRVDPDNFQNTDDGLFSSEDDVEESDDTELDDEPVDEDGDPTGEHDHQQDDNYALGGHVTRSGSV